MMIQGENLVTDQQVTIQTQPNAEQAQVEMINLKIQPQIASDTSDNNYDKQSKGVQKSVVFKDGGEENKTGFLTKLKKLFQFKQEQQDEQISQEEQNRRYQIAMRGWKKVKSVLRIIQYKRKVGILDSYTPKESRWSYETFLFLPFSNIRFYFLLLESTLILYNVFLVPFRYSFSMIDDDLLMTIDIVMDALFACSVILKFFCAYVDKTRMVKEFKSIAFRYIFGFLWMDSSGLFFFEVAALFPYYLFSDWYGLRFLRMLQIGSVLEYFQLFCNKILGFFTSNINLTKSLTTILQFLHLLCIIAQYLSCFWYYLGIKKDVEMGFDRNGKGMRMVSGWVYEQLYTEEGDEDPLIGKNIQTEFVTSLYWVFTTLTTLGYGDFYGQTTNEQIFTMFVEFLGVFIFAYMMGNINNLIEKLNDDHLEYIQNENENLDQWIIKIDRANPTRKLPQSFVDDLRKRFTIYWQRDHTTVVEEFPFFNQLPVDLRTQLVDHIFKGFIDRFSVFFKGLEIQFIHAVVVNLYPKKYTQAEHEGRKQIDIIPIDTCPNDIFFITKGNVTIASKDGVHKFITLSNGSYFGDHLILYNLKSSNAFMAIEEDVECMCIDKKKFLDLCDFYPYSHKILKYKAYARRKHFREVKMKIMEYEDNQRPKYSINNIDSNNQAGGGTQNIQMDSQQNSNKILKSQQASFQKTPIGVLPIEKNTLQEIDSKNFSPVMNKKESSNPGKDMKSLKITQTVSHYSNNGKINLNNKINNINVNNNNNVNSDNNNGSNQNLGLQRRESIEKMHDINEIPNFVQFVEDVEMQKDAIVKKIEKVDQINNQFKKYIHDNIKQNDDKNDDENENEYNQEEENRKNEILKLAKDLHEKIELLKKSLCMLDSDIKEKVSNIKTELEFITSYEEVLHDFEDEVNNQ